MRILLLSTYFVPDASANGTLMSQLCQEWVRLGHSVSVVTSMPHYDTNRIWPQYRGRIWAREAHNGIDVRRVFVYVPANKASLWRRLLSYMLFNMLSSVAALSAGKCDVLLTPSPPLTNGLAAFVVSRLKRIPYIYNVQDIYPDVAIRLGVLRNKRAISAFQRMERFVYSKAAGVTVISQGFRQNLLRKGVPESKVHVIPNFVDTGFVMPLARHNVFSKSQDLDGRFVVLFAGNIGLSQGLETVLEAAKCLSRYPQILFLIAGNGASKQSLVERAGQMGLSNVRFLPFQPHEVVPQMYASADVCLVPLRRSLTEESVPSKVFTILGAARPLVASVDKESETWRLVRESGSGVCVEPENAHDLADAILMLYGDPQLGLKMGQSGRQFVEASHTCQRVAKQYEELFVRLVSNTDTSHALQHMIT
jgi:colanic acid biosynthesis glycosyl transferase WcaI